MPSRPILGCNLNSRCDGLDWASANAILFAIVANCYLKVLFELQLAAAAAATLGKELYVGSATKEAL